uniref:Uncharacterized protein n=1 Tax=Panagrolaimus sp. PS1159 TaxID=55785 RepID=A0AC35G9D3_9BILA
MRVLSLITFCSLTSFAFASYCGQSGIPFSFEALANGQPILGIPFSFEALANGQPILGCARPSCFGWNADGKRSADAAQFYKIGKQSDGFLRSTDIQGPIVKNATYFRPQFSICDRSYMSEQCAENQWVGGISPLPKIIPGSIFKVMCCSYTKLMESSDQGIAEIKGGETVVGGEIHGEDGRQHSFEYISNIQRRFNQKGE